MADHIQRICDACNEVDKIVPADTSIGLTVDGQDHRLDLCKDHYAEIWEPVAAVLPITRRRPRVASSDFQCPDCGDSCSTLSALSRHRHAAHGFIPYDHNEGCPYCSRQEFFSQQALSVHVNNSHRPEHIERLTTERSN